MIICKNSYKFGYREKKRCKKFKKNRRYHPAPTFPSSYLKKTHPRQATSRVGPA